MTEKQILTACIESHRRMIAYHRRQIIELSRKAIKESDSCIECFDMEIINESGRSGKSEE
jgi:hypothetical protein